MFVSRCVQPLKHQIPFQNSFCWIAGIRVERSKVTTAGEVALKDPSSRHIIHCHNSSALNRLAALLPQDLSGTQVYKEKQVVLGLPATTLGFRKQCKLDNSNRVPLGSRAFFSVKGKNRSSGGRDSDLFEEWLKANPLPDVSIQEFNQKGNGRLALDAHYESIAPAEEFRAYHNSGNEKLKITEGKMPAEESGEFDILPETNRTLDRQQELPLVKANEPPYDNVNDVLDGQVKASGLRLGEKGLQHLREFSWQETGDVLYECLCNCEELAWDCQQKRFLEFLEPQSVMFSSGQCLVASCPSVLSDSDWPMCWKFFVPRYFQSLRQRRDRQGNKQLLALLSSNAAALAIFNEGKLLLHKVITAYTVRAKQGKSQRKYLRQGGPGRMTVGGAIRAREADRFVTRVCEKLDEWGNEIQDCDVLFFSGTTRVWNEVYAAENPKMIVPRNDSRWCKVPFNVHEPRLREVKRVFYRLSHGAVSFSCHHEERPPP